MHFRQSRTNYEDSFLQNWTEHLICKPALHGLGFWRGGWDVCRMFCDSLARDLFSSIVTSCWFIGLWWATLGMP